jgi:DNA replication initiation complex subunit (GINS family)
MARMSYRKKNSDTQETARNIKYAELSRTNKPIGIKRMIDNCHNSLYKFNPEQKERIRELSSRLGTSIGFSQRDINLLKDFNKRARKHDN